MQQRPARHVQVTSLVLLSIALAAPGVAQGMSNDTYTVSLEPAGQTLFIADRDSVDYPTFLFCIDSNQDRSALLTLTSKMGAISKQTVARGTCVFVKSQKIDVSRVDEAGDSERTSPDWVRIRFTYLGE